MQEKKTFIVGDVHGCFEEFLALLKKLNYESQKHRLILVGDLIGKGPYSLEMLNWVKTHNIEFVRGNHEQAFIHGVKENTLIIGSVLEKLKEAMGKSLQDWMVWLEKSPFFIEEKNFLVVHAGLVPDEKPHLSDPNILMNIRTWDRENTSLKGENKSAWHDFYQAEKLIIYGHWARQGLKIKSNSIGLDTGCVYGKHLTGILLPERKVLQVSALKTYCKVETHSV